MWLNETQLEIAAYFKHKLLSIDQGLEQEQYAVDEAITIISQWSSSRWLLFGILKADPPISQYSWSLVGQLLRSHNIICQTINRQDLSCSGETVLRALVGGILRPSQTEFYPRKQG